MTDAYRLAATSEAPYAIVRGTLRLDPANWPQTQIGKTDTRDTTLEAELEGVALGPLGAREVFAQRVLVNVTCTAGVCPEWASGDVLAFVRRAGRRFEIDQATCGGFLFQRPSHATVHYVQSCLNQKACPTGAEIYQRLIEEGRMLPPVARD